VDQVFRIRCLGLGLTFFVGGRSVNFVLVVGRDGQRDDVPKRRLFGARGDEFCGFRFALLLISSLSSGRPFCGLPF
jgi:hypothetical protein